MLTNRTSRLAAAVALNILADAFSDRPAQAHVAPQPVIAGNLPLGFIEYSRSEHVQSDDFRSKQALRDAVSAIERKLPYVNDLHLGALKNLLRDIENNASRDNWSAVALCTGVMCIPGQVQECVKVVYVLADGSTRSATWFKQ